MKPDPTSLDRLHDLVTPPPMPWWPPTPGWCIVLAVVSFALIAWAMKAFMRWQADRYRREALAVLDGAKAGELSGLTKRVALSVWPREEVARLTGEGWLAFLDKSANVELFSKGPGADLERAAFEPAAAVDEASLKAAVREWILKHRREAAE